MSQMPGGLFHQNWWLDAVAPERWAAAEVRAGDTLVARLPYVVHRTCGMTLISRPPLTPALGPWVQASSGKRAQQMRREKDWIEGLLTQLPTAARTTVTCHPGLVNALPFHWSGYDLRVRYTHILPDLSDLAAVWSGFDSNIRTDIRKAQKQVTVRDDLSLDAFLDVYEKTFHRQGQRLPLARASYRTMDTAAAARGHRRMLFAADRQGRVHAAIYLVWDEERAYYLLGGADPLLRSSGAGSLLLWEAIQFSATVTKSFDFEGSMIESIERFFRAFGGVPTPYYVASRTPNRILKAANVLLRGAA